MLVLQNTGGLVLTLVAGVAFLVFGGYLLWKVIARIDLAAEFRLASATTPSTITQQEAAKIRGTAQSNGEYLRAPVDGREVLATSHKIEVLREDDDGGTDFHEKTVLDDSVQFSLEADDGSVARVDSGATLYLSDEDSTTEIRVGSLAVDADDISVDLSNERQTRHTQTTVESGDEVIAYGTARPAEDGSAEIAEGEAADHFVIVDKTDALPSVTVSVLAALFSVVFVLVGLGLSGLALIALLGL